MRSSIASAAVCVVALLAAVPAAAQPEPETVVTGEIEPARTLRPGEELVTAIVRYGDLDLASQSGVEALNGRVYRAATRLCVEDGPQSLEWRHAGIVCRDGAVAGAQRQIALAIADHGRGSSLAAASLVIRAAR